MIILDKKMRKIMRTQTILKIHKKTKCMDQIGNEENNGALGKKPTINVLIKNRSINNKKRPLMTKVIFSVQIKLVS